MADNKGITISKARSREHTAIDEDSYVEFRKDGRKLFTVYWNPEGNLEIASDGSKRLEIHPKSSNLIELEVNEYDN